MGLEAAAREGRLFRLIAGEHTDGRGGSEAQHGDVIGETRKAQLVHLQADPVVERLPRDQLHEGLQHGGVIQQVHLLLLKLANQSLGLGA